MLSSTMKKKKEEAKDPHLIDWVLSWSIADIMNQNLYKHKVHPIPDTFSSVHQYLNSFVVPLLEETRADLRSSLTGLRSAPSSRIFDVPSKHLLCFTPLEGESKIDGTYEPGCGDLIAITEVRPKCIDDLNGSKRPYTVAYVMSVMDDDVTLKIRIVSSNPIDFEEGDVIFAVYLTNLTTNRRIWNALHPSEGGNTKIVSSVLDVSLSEDKCTVCSKATMMLPETMLNDSQRDAVLDSVALTECGHGKTRVKMLWGPPGTGKTKTIATLAFVLLRKRCRTLICAPTNVAVLGITKRLMSCLDGYLLHGTYGLGDVVLFGNGKRMKIDEHRDLHDIFLDNRVRVLGSCFAPETGWRGSLDKMIRLLEDPHGQYQQYLVGKLGNKYISESDDVDKNNEHRKVSSVFQGLKESLISIFWKKTIVNSIKEDQIIKKKSCSESECEKNPIDLLTFEKFIAETFRSAREGLIFSLTGLYTHMPTSFVPLKTLEHMIKVIDLLNHRLVKQTLTGKREVGLKALEQTFALRRIRLEGLQAMHYIRNHLPLPESINAYNFCLQNACLIFCTVSSSSKLHTEGMNPFEIAIIDEAAQVKECETNIPLQLPGLQHAILVGDEKQLPAMVISKICEKAEFGRSLFERLVKLGHSKHLLGVQYRMHPSISMFPNKEFYEKQIKNGWNVTEKSYEKRLLEGKLFGPYSFINVTHAKEEFDSRHSRKNLAEASVVAEIVSRLSKQCMKSGQKVRVGCLSPYKGQVVAIQELLGKSYSTDPKDAFSVNVKSVDGFQGGEEDVIIMSTVRCNGNGSVGFLDNRNRTNVALTRAKYCLWIIGNGATLLNSGSIWKKLVMNAKSRGCFYNAYEDTSLSLAVSEVLVESRQLSSLFSTDSILFKVSKWKVCFSLEFNNSVMRLSDVAIVKELVSLVVKISNGWRQQKNKVDNTCDQLLEGCDLNGGLRLLWTVDVIRVNRIDTQVIRILDIIAQSETSEMVKSFGIVLGNYTVNRMNRCLCKRAEGDLLVPVTWRVDMVTDGNSCHSHSHDELAGRLESLSLRNERPRSRNKRYGRKNKDEGIKSNRN